MFLLNKTADYVSKLSNTDLGTFISKVRIEERDLRKKAKQRQETFFRNSLKNKNRKRKK